MRRTSFRQFVTSLKIKYYRPNKSASHLCYHELLSGYKKITHPLADYDYYFNLLELNLFNPVHFVNHV